MRNILFAAILFTTACTSKTPETVADSTATATDSTASAAVTTTDTARADSTVVTPTTGEAAK